MSQYRYQADANTKEIVQALRDAGAVVEYVTNVRKAGVPDLFVGFMGLTFLLEVKAPDAKMRNREKGGRTLLSEAQEAWADRWRGGPLVIVQSAREALAAIGAL